ncbi:hypothetical protein CVT24_006000 [Panaeolus cyanescens]|uniref:Autophagy-related protein 11 n=1 Tax=Panaeolus cyanescens TaxID=181874 RepID=A0A409YDZ3_9AGAR|nr:hypothetical protein CVT24_006000 [Panaeolus cyanescens]
MIAICTAENGHLIQVNASLRDIESAGSLELFLHNEVDIEPDAVLAYLSNGKRLTTSNIRDIHTVQDQLIFVFNKYFLDYDLDDVLNKLNEHSAFQPPVEDPISSTPPLRHTQLATSYARSALAHHEQVQRIVHSMALQQQSLQMSSNNLDLHVLATSETYDGIVNVAEKELKKQESLLKGLEADLDLLARVNVHLEFCSPAVRQAIEEGSPPRVLTDYVSREKMLTVAEACAKSHEELVSEYQKIDKSIAQLKQGADSIRTSAGNDMLLEDAKSCLRRSQDLMDRITDSAAVLESPASDLNVVLPELKQLDLSHRQELQQVIDKKNLYTRQIVSALRHISSLNNAIIRIPPELAKFQADLRNQPKFSHIQRLHNMLHAYGATIIEIVRRKEFTRFFYQRAQAILETMAKVSSAETKRQRVYRSEILDQLPFKLRGLDVSVPTIDFSPEGGTESVYSLERADVDDWMTVLNDLENWSRSKNDLNALNAVIEARTAVEKLINKMDNLELSFDKIAERSLLSASRMSQSRRRSTEAEERAIQELTEELRAAQEAQTLQEQSHRQEKNALQAEIHRLNQVLGDSTSELSVEQDRTSRLERELQQVRAQMESEGVARRILEERNGELTADISRQRDKLSRALADATKQAKEADELRKELAQVKADFEEVKAYERRNSEKAAQLLEEQANNLRILEEARARGEDLEAQIQAVRSESSEMRQALRQASLEKDRLLRAQASEHDKIIRDHKAEADGDRAVLDRQFSELQATLEATEQQLKKVQGDLDVSNADADGLRRELQRIEIELREARHVEELLRNDLSEGRASRSVYEQRLETSNQLVAQIMDVSINFRNSHVKALQAVQAMAVHPGSLRHNNTHNNLAESMPTFSGPPPTSFRQSLIGQVDEPPPIDPSDPTTALEQLREFDHDHFIETVMKTNSIIRKWQKQCKEYRERAKGKISFRNFAKGDLALFLPTRNSVSKNWAAFNVSFPHYFLQATGHLADQLKSREWIVARIMSITERVVDQKDPSSNPYGLGEGVKYYMLEVEDWTQPSTNKRRQSSRKVSNDEARDIFQNGGLRPLSPTALPTPGPPDGGEVEDSFLVAAHANSHFFPTRARANSSPQARPSSLSRLLAQAPSGPEPAAAEPLTSQDNTVVPPAAIRTPSPRLADKVLPLPSSSYNTASGSAPHSPSVGNFNSRHNVNTTNTTANPNPIITSSSSNNNANVPVPVPSASSPSPLRPGSRASRLSNASKFSVGRIPPGLGAVVGNQTKAAPTTALSDQQLSVDVVSSASSASPRVVPAELESSSPFRSPTVEIGPSHTDETVTSLAQITQKAHRRRTASPFTPRTSPLADPTVTTLSRVEHPSPSTSTQPAAFVASRPAMIATNTLANLATSWGMSFGRKKRSSTTEVDVSSNNAEPAVQDGSVDDLKSTTSTITKATAITTPTTTKASTIGERFVSDNANTSARDLLKRF